jgi:hypothetical protein
MRDSGDAMGQNAIQATQLMQKAKTGLQAMGNDPYALMALASIEERQNPSSPKIRQLLEKACALGYEPAAEKLSNL